MKWGQSPFSSKRGRTWRLDGKPVTPVIQGATAANACKGNGLQGEWRAPPKFASLYGGLERYADSANDQNLWIDDVALSKARVGCPGKTKGKKR